MDQKRSGAILSYIQIFVNLIVGLLMTPILLGYLGKSEYGLYQIVGSFFSYVTLFESCTTASVLRYYCYEKDKNHQEQMANVLALSRIIFWIFSAVVAVISFGCIIGFEYAFQTSLSDNEIAEAKFMIILMAVNFICTLLNTIYLAGITAYEKFVFLKLLLIVSKIFQPIVCVLILECFYPLAICIVIAQLALNLIVVLTRYLYAIRRLKIKVELSGFDFVYVKKILFFASTILLASIADQVFWKTDQLILGKLYNTGIVAVYSIGAQIFFIYMSFGVALSQLFFPQLSRLYHSNNGIYLVSELFIKVGRISFQVLFLVLTTFYFFGREFISLWVGDQYVLSYYVALIIMIPYTIDIIQNLGLSILQVMNRYSFRAKMFFVAAVLKIFITLYLADIYGCIGAAIATSVVILSISGFVMNIYFKKQGMDVVKFWKNIISIIICLLPAIVCGGIVSWMFYPIASWISFFSASAIYCLIYTANLYFIAMNDFEKGILNSILNKVGINRNC